MSLLPRIDEIVITNKEHKSCSYTIRAVLNDVKYSNYHEAECVTMTMVKVCPKCGKTKYICKIPVPVNAQTIQKYNIDLENNVKITMKQEVHVDFVCTSFDYIYNVTGYIQNVYTFNYVNENTFKIINGNQDPLTIEVINEIIENKHIYLNLNYGINGYDNDGHLQWLYQETTMINNIEVEMIYTKTIVN